MTGNDRENIRDAPNRCPWAKSDLSIRYHDLEWGVPLHGDDALFGLLILEGAQAGLSWETILRKRERYHQVFDAFEITKVARYDERKIESLLADAGIIRNRAKIVSAITNAQATRKIQREFGSFDTYIWSFVNGMPIVNRRRSFRDTPASTKISDKLSADLKQRGFRFVGSTICYAFMQSCGMVNDHLINCFRAEELKNR
ncbi:MAG TPA: DNA-3-methyladenine glycosylase I [Candidatus Baltobacteraceae bacterium]|jgi:DNA-3-methyladenine glycosylase I|nr:DNA-3-methyladenine glycosylase I [Candidatus Baltobacteraceae bacterium]